MQCPKCGGEAYLVDEELVQVLENIDPPKIIAKAIYQCRSCSERFTRLVTESLDAKKKSAEPASPFPPGRGATHTDPEATADFSDRLRFF
jgi:phage terminase large subunit GpA-like protein